MSKCFRIGFLLLAVALLSFTRDTAADSFQTTMQFGYTDKGDSLEFVFGQQKMINFGSLEFVLDKRRAEIKHVNLAGDFNNWSPDNALFRLKKSDSKLYKLVLRKSSIGKKGELHQFKFVLNEKYWIDPPVEAANRITGKDGYTNLFLRL